MKSPQPVRLQDKKCKSNEEKTTNNQIHDEEFYPVKNTLNANENDIITGELRSIVSRILTLQEDVNLLQTQKIKCFSGTNTKIAHLIQSDELCSSVSTLKHYIHHCKPNCKMSESNLKIDSNVHNCLKNLKKTPNSDNKNADQSKGIIYKDVCITGEKLNLWKKIKSNVISTVTDLKSKEGTVSKLRIDTKVKDHKDKKTNISKNQQNLYPQTFLNLNCENILVKTSCKGNGNNSQEFKSSIRGIKQPNSLGVTDECITVPLLKFTDGSKANTKSISKCSSDEVQTITCSTSCNNCTKKAKGLRVKVTKSSKVIVIKSTYSLKQKSNVTKEKWTQVSNKNKECKTISSACNISAKCSVKTSGMQAGCKTITSTAQTQHSKITCKDKNSCTSRNIQRSNVQKRCVSTQKIIDIGCGDRMHTISSERKNKCGHLPYTKENEMYNQFKKIICKFRYPTTKSTPNRKNICSSNKILCNKKAQCNKEKVATSICIGTQCNFFKKSSPYKCDKQPLTSNSCKKIKCQLKTVGIQCMLLIPNTCRTKRYIQCPKSIKKSVCQRPRLITIGTQYKEKCSKIHLSKYARKLKHTVKQKKNCFKCKLPTQVSSSIQTIFPKPSHRACKHRKRSKVAKPKLCTCTKTLLASKSSELCYRRKVPMLKSSSMETLYPKGFEKCKCKPKQHQQTRCSIFNFRTPKFKPCRCVTSLIYFNGKEKCAKKGSTVKINCHQPVFYPAFCDRSNLCYKYGRGDFLCRKSQNVLSRQKCLQHHTVKTDKCFQKQAKNPCPLLSCNNKKNRSCSIYDSFKWPVCCPYSYRCDYKPRCLTQSNSSPCQHFYSCLKSSEKCKSIPHSMPFVTCKRKKRCSRFNCFIKKVFKPLYCAISSRRCGRKCKRWKLGRPALDYKCDKIYMKTVRRGRCKFIYKFCPWMYPECIHFLQGCKQNLHLFFIAVTCVAWCPIILVLELLRVCCCYFCCD